MRFMRIGPYYIAQTEFQSLQNVLWNSLVCMKQTTQYPRIRGDGIYAESLMTAKIKG
jgi:hypothetical protein